MSKQILLAFLLAAVAVSQATLVTECGGTATLRGVDVQGCTDSVNARCQFVKGRQYNVEVRATANGVATALPYTAKANILGIPITLFDGNACESLTEGDCPAGVGEGITFLKAVNITNNYPALDSTLKVEVKDHANVLLLCAEIRFSIVNA